jgi:hypothetical protein
MERQDGDSEGRETVVPDLVTLVTTWLRTWGPAFGCFVAAFALLQLSGGKTGAGPAYFTWPENLQEVQVVDNLGSRKIRLMRIPLPEGTGGGWTIRDGMIVQGNPEDGTLVPCQVHVTVANDTGRTFYVSAFDFTLVDSNGQKFNVDPSRMLQMENGIAGRWLRSGEAWSGWLVFPRRDAAIIELLFAPDRFTHIDLRTTR